MHNLPTFYLLKKKKICRTMTPSPAFASSQSEVSATRLRFIAQCSTATSWGIFINFMKIYFDLNTIISLIYQELELSWTANVYRVLRVIRVFLQNMQGKPWNNYWIALQSLNITGFFCNSFMKSKQGGFHLHLSSLAFSNQIYIVSNALELEWHLKWLNVITSDVI